MFFNKKIIFGIFILFLTLVISGCFRQGNELEMMKSHKGKTYQNSQYDFSLQFPDNWINNFSILEEKQNDIAVFSFVYNQLLGKEYPIFRLVVYPYDVWQEYKNLQELILNQEVFTYSNDYVFVLERTLNNPYSSPQMEQFITLNKGVEEIIQSFQIEKGKEFNLDKIKVYFNNSKFNPEMLDCRLVYPTIRSITSTMSYEEQALRELFSGPTTEEKEVGFESFFNTTTIDILNSIKILENTALIDLKDIRKIIPNANSSCGSAQFLAQIEKTLKEFPNIYQVYMAINKDPNKIYEWLQLGCTEMNFYCDEKPFTFKSEIDGANIEIPIVANSTTNTQEEIMDVKTE